MTLNGLEVLPEGSDEVYPVDFISNVYCKEFTTMSVEDLAACSEIHMLEVFIAFGNIALGLFLGYMTFKAVSDAWRG